MDSTFSSDLTYVLNSTTLSIQVRIEKIQEKIQFSWSSFTAELTGLTLSEFIINYVHN